MFRSPDGKVTVDVAKTLGDSVFPAADFSILNIPLEPDVAKSMFTNLYDSPSRRHIVLALCRHPRKDKLQALSNLAGQDRGFDFLDQVHLWYEKPSTSSNIGFLPITEDGYLFYKGDTPNVKNTAWFADGSPNATNLWGLTPHEGEGRAATYHRKFAWETALLLYTMCDPVEHKRMIYALDDDHEHALKFAKTYGMQVHFVVSSEALAKNILSRYEVT